MILKLMTHLAVISRRVIRICGENVTDKILDVTDDGEVGLGVGDAPLCPLI